MIVIVFNSILLGLGLAMDAFSVSVAEGLAEPEMKSSRMFLISGTFAVFQFAMPVIGWLLILLLVDAFEGLANVVPFIAFALLAFIGGKMILESMNQRKTENAAVTSIPGLLALGLATSLDALSAGTTMTEYDRTQVIIGSLIIGAMTLIVCFSGIIIGKKIGDRFSSKAGILGGCVLLSIALKSLIEGIINLL